MASHGLSEPEETPGAFGMITPRFLAEQGGVREVERHPTQPLKTNPVPIRSVLETWRQDHLCIHSSRETPLFRGFR